MKELAPQDFAPAPCGARIKFVVAAIIVLLASLDVFLAFQFFDRNAHARYTLLVGAFVPGVVVGFLILGMGIRSYRFEGKTLRVVRRMQSPVVSLEGVTACVRQPDILVGARKVYGNDGIGAISGVYNSQAHGKFRAFLTDPKKAVLLTLANGEKLAVSPEHTQPFIDAVRKRLG